MDQWYHKFDFLTLFLWAGLVAVGLVAIYSTTHGPAAEYLRRASSRTSTAS